MRIKTTGGYVEGFEENGLQNFLGIPYARAERFQAPREINWEGMFQADAFGKKAVQSHPAQETQAGLEGRKEYGEDCLNLNIYVSARAALRRAGKEGACLWRSIFTAAHSRTEATVTGAENRSYAIIALFMFP